MPSLSMEILPPFERRVDIAAADFALANLADLACGLHLYREKAVSSVFCVSCASGVSCVFYASCPFCTSYAYTAYAYPNHDSNSFVQSNPVTRYLPIEMRLVLKNEKRVRSISLSLGWILRTCPCDTGKLKKTRPEQSIEQQEKHSYEPVADSPLQEQ